MKKIIAIALMVVVIMLCATGCNSEGPLIKYRYAYVSLPNGDVLEVVLEDFHYLSNHLMLWGQDGEYYLVGCNNCIITTIQLDCTESEE